MAEIPWVSRGWSADDRHRARCGLGAGDDLRCGRACAGDSLADARGSGGRDALESRRDHGRERHAAEDLPFNTTESIEDLTRVFRESLDGNFVRREGTATDPRLSLAGRAGGFWITLQLTPPEAGRTVATWSAAPRFIEGVKRRVVLPPGFPDDAKLLQHVDSYDDDKRSQMAIGRTLAPVDAAVARFLDRMKELGYTKQPFPSRNWNGSSEYSAVFANGREELVVSMQQEPQGTALVFNRISALERLP